MTKSSTPDPDKITELDRLYNDPDTAPTLDLFERFRKKTLQEAGFRDFLKSLPSDAAPEIAKIDKIISEPDARVEADLSTRSKQLAWTAALGFLYQNSPPNTIRKHGIWGTLTSSPAVKSTLGTAARYLDLSLTNRNATMNWGTPGSWFWYSPDKNHINIDLFNTLLLGFAPAPNANMRGMAHATAVMLHEVGHSQHTTRWTDGMNVLREKEKGLLEKAKKDKLTRDEYKQLIRTQMEVKLRHNIMNAAEDNCVNRYAVNQGRTLPYDISASLNVCNVLLQGTGYYLKTRENKPGGHSDFTKIIGEFLKGKEQKELEKAEKALTGLGKSLMMAFYTSNGLFDTADTATWQRIGIEPAAVTGANGRTFGDLMKANLAPDGVANLQPAVRDSWLLRNLFAKSVEDYATRRCKIIDGIWDDYAAQHAKILLDALENNLDRQMDKTAEQNKKQGQEGQQGDKGQNSSKNGGSGKKSDDQKDGDDPSPASSSGTGENTPGDGGDEQNDTVNVKGVGKMKAGKPAPATPKDAQDQGNDDVGQDEGQSVRDLARATKAEAQKNEAGQGKDGQRPDKLKDGPPAEPDKTISSGGSSGVRREVDLTQLSEGDWQEYRRRINELEPVINRVSNDFAYIRDRQKQYTMTMSKELEDTPRGGNILQRLDMRAQMNLAAKIASGQRIENVDRQRWRKDKMEIEPTSVELWILGDGSGSTRSSLSDGGRRIDSCLQTMAILREAGKRAGFDVYAGVWENHGVRMLAEPGFTDVQIGKNFDSVKNDGGCGTIYNTPFPGIIERLSKQTTDAQGRPKRFAGMTHFLWVVDGTANDLEIDGTAEMLIKLFRQGPAVSVDIAYMGGYRNCETKAIVEKVKAAVPGAQIDTLEATKASDAPLLLSQKIKKRFERSAHVIKAVPDQQKREAFSNAYRTMKR